MTTQVPWNKIILEEFINLALLTKDEEMILRTRIYTDGQLESKPIDWI